MKRPGSYALLPLLVVSRRMKHGENDNGIGAYNKEDAIRKATD